MTRNKNNNRTENKNTRSNARKAYGVFNIVGNCISDSFASAKAAQAWLDKNLPELATQHQRLWGREFTADDFTVDVIDRSPSKGEDVNVKVEFTHVETDTRVEPAKQSPSQQANEKAEKQAKREAEREAAKAAREREHRLAQKFDETCMSVNDALRNVAAHTNDELEEGFTVGDYMAEKGLTKLTVKALREALPSDFVREDGIYMPTTQAAVYEGAPEDERNGKAVYYCTTNGSDDNKRKVWKKAQLYGFSRITLWTPSVVRRLLTAGMTYADKQAHYAKRNAEVKATKHFFLLNERTEKAVSGKKVNQKSVVENYVEIANENVKWAC